MKSTKTLKLLPLLAAPLFAISCTPTTEYHSVRVYEYTPKKVTKKAPSDDPRDFRPVGLGN